MLAIINMIRFSCAPQGPAFVDDINAKFTASMTNVVRWREAPPPAAAPDDDDTSEEAPAVHTAASASNGAASSKEITSETTIEVTLEVPRWAGLAPVGALEGAGSGVLQSALNLMVPRFLQQLQADYSRWAAGDASRKPLGDGAL